MATLRRDHLTMEPNCRECAKAQRFTPATTVDHDKWRIERGGKPRTPIGADGWPL
jgi:hypothetical protein